MTDIDWAENIAEMLRRDQIYSNSGQGDIDAMVIALRRAKSDGMREAADRIEALARSAQRDFDLDRALMECRTRAAAIERGYE